MLASILCYFFPPLVVNGEAFFFFFIVMMVVSSVGSSLAFLMAAATDNAEGAANIHNTIIGFMGTYAGFFLPSLLIPVFEIWMYYLSFMKYSFEALELNQWGNCASYYMKTQFLSLDLTLNKWTNLLILMAYPIVFYLFSFVALLTKTGELSDYMVSCSCRSTKHSSSPSKDQENIHVDTKPLMEQVIVSEEIEVENPSLEFTSIKSERQVEVDTKLSPSGPAHDNEMDSHQEIEMV